MRLKRNNRIEAKLQLAHGYCSTVWLGHYIKEYRYQGVPLMRWYAKQELLEFFDYKTEVRRVHPDFSPSNSSCFFRCKARTIKNKYRFFAPPGIEIQGRLGCNGGYWVITDGRKIPLSHHLLIPYKGVV